MHSDNEATETPSNTGDRADNTSPTVKGTARLGGRRTHRACDRCRVKKSKCNGHQPCNTCKSNERTCVFSALRRRDIRKWHCHMQDTIDEAIQRLYRACKESANFPGVLPDEQNGYVSTESILQGMGFTHLELGPRTGMPPSSGASTLPPLQTQFTNVPLGSMPADTTHTSPNRYPPLYRDSEANEASPRADHGASQHEPHANFGMIPVGQTPQSPVSIGTTRSMPEQFHEGLHGPMTHDGLEYLHHHFRPSPHHQLPSPSNTVTHFDPHNIPNVARQPHSTQQPLHDRVRSDLPWGSQERYIAPAESLYNGEAYINPSQDWPEFHGYASVPQ